MKLLITDIDGSLLPFGQSEISPALIEFFHGLDPSQVRVTFATGKPFSRALPLAQALNITTPLICANGALVKDPVTKEVLACEPIETSIATGIIELLAADPRCQLYPEVKDTLFYVQNSHIPFDAWRHRRPGWIEPTPYDPSKDMMGQMGGSPHKIAVSTSPSDRDTIEALIQNKFGDQVHIFHPKPDIIDITSKNVDKGTAALSLAKLFGIPREDIIVVGDELNDLSLFEIAGTKLAREHAPQALLDQADQIVATGDTPLILALKQTLKS
ncbi:HAD hydrolase family protein [Patescibacteria group bacterium]|nr:HAD hydrolase family protein [Patescibacteria group bacterium]MBP9709602.1 HAD hydrolase family protein [Patescibacteria group bacterium]